MRLALVSLDQRWEDKAANRARCDQFAAQAAAAGCDLVVFPEMTLTGFSMNVGQTGEDANDSETLRWFGELAKRHGLTALFGMVATNYGSPRPRNVAALARPDGGAEIIYAKTHTFSYAGEHETIDSGDGLGTFTLGTSRVGVGICYDLRFPELYAVMGPSCDMVITIANWPNGRTAHWRALLVARAIENQAYMVGVNRIGADGKGLGYDKATMVVAPEGTPVEPATASDELDVFDLNLDAVARYRSRFPTVRDRRPDLYRRLSEGVDARR